MLTLITPSGGGGATTYAALTDKASVDLPTVNTPLATALGLKAGLVANTFTGAQTLAPATPGTALTLTSGTVTASLPAFNLTQTWNNGAVAFTTALINITNTASAITSKFFDIQSGGSSCIFAECRSSSVPVLCITRGPVAATQWMELSVSGDTCTTNLTYDSAFSWNVLNTSKMYLYPTGNQFGLSSNITLGWSSTTAADGTRDLILGRKAAASLQLGLDAAGVTNQTLTAASRITSDGVGANLTLDAGNGRGGASGSIIFRTAPAAGSGVAGTYATRLSIDGNGLITMPTAGAASTPALLMSGAPYTAGTATTNHPLLYLNAGTAPTTWSADGTALGINLPNASTSNFLDFHLNGGTSVFKVDSTGDLYIRNTAAITYGIRWNLFPAASDINLGAIATTVAIGANNNAAIIDTGYQGSAKFRAYKIIIGESTDDLYLRRKAAASLQLGDDAAGVTNQTLTAASRITSDGVGADLTIAPGNGRGGAGGTLILSTYTTAGAATIGTLTSRMTIDTAGAIAFPNVTAVVTETVVSDRTLAVTINGTAYKICLKA
jgi:hypothetical protein